MGRNYRKGIKMEKPIMLITGTSRGIGLACAKRFNDSHTVIGVARTSGEFVTEVGDITNIDFRNMLIEKYTPDVFVNNAGISGARKFDDLCKINMEAAGALLLGFYKKMSKGNIINLSSWNANISGSTNTSIAELSYKASKVFLKNLSNNLTNKRSNAVLITSLEPQNVYTGLISSLGFSKPTEDDYKNYNFKSNAPMTTEYIAETINWIITQPPWVCIKSLELSNAYEAR
jgi:NADP-dependent 3-hydroxy acid dehydrogenase YdfG